MSAPRRIFLVPLGLWFVVLAAPPLWRLLRRSGGAAPPPAATKCDAREFHLDAVNGERKVASLEIGCFRDSTLTAKRLQDVKVRLYPRSGEPVDISAKSGTLIQTAGIALQLEDHVVLDWRGTRLTGDKLFFRDSDDSGELTAAGGLRGARDAWTLTTPRASFNLEEGVIRFPSALTLRDDAAGRTLEAAGGGRYRLRGAPDGGGLLSLETVTVRLPAGILQTTRLEQREAGAATLLDLPEPLTFAGAAGSTLSAARGALRLAGGRIESGELDGGGTPVEFATPRPARLTAPRVLIAEDEQHRMTITALDGAALETPQDPRIRSLRAPEIAGLFVNGAPQSAAFKGGGAGSGPGGDFTAREGAYDFAAGGYRLAGEARVTRAADQLQADEMTGSLAGDAAARGTVSGRRGSGAEALRFSGAQATLAPDGRITLEGAPARAARGPNQVAAARMEIDDVKQRHRASGGVELVQDDGARRVTAAGETLEMDYAAERGALTGGVALMQRDTDGQQFKARGTRADLKLAGRRITEAVLSDPAGQPVFGESPRYLVSGARMLYRTDSASGEVTADPPARVSVRDRESGQTLFGNRAEITEGGRSIVITSSGGGRTRKETAASAPR